jgi:hypothetical protein
MLTKALFGLGSAAGLTPALAGATGSYGGPYGSSHGSQRTVYNNIPDPEPGNVPSVGFEATSASEFGGQLGLDGNKREDPKITVLMSSWACKSGTWNAKNCITNPGSTFTHPVTLNVYKVNDDDSVGDKIASETKTFTMPYRPTADDGTNCKDANGNPTGAWYDGEACNNGKAFPISFKLDGVTLPDDVIIGVAYNTSHHGYAPIGETACNTTPQGCPYDSLNVGTNPTPTKGEAQPTADDAYYNTSFAGFYCDGGTGGSGTFRLDEGCWTGFLPAIRVQAEGGGRHHGHHHNRHHDDKGKHHGHHHNRGWDKHRHHKHHAFNYLERR